MVWRKEVGDQNNSCQAVPQHEERGIIDTAGQNVLDKLALAVDGVAGKLGVIESRLPALENLFIYLGFYVAFNTVQVISQRVVGRAEETST